MTPVSDDVLEGITAGEGVSIIFSNIHTTVNFNPLIIEDTDGTSLTGSSGPGYIILPAFSGDFDIDRLETASNRIGEYGDVGPNENDYAYYDYSTLEPKPLTVDLYDSGNSPSWLPGGGVAIGLPTIKLSITEWDSFELIGNDTKDLLSTNLFATISMANNFLEILGGNVGISARAGQGVNIYCNDVELYWNTTLFNIQAVEGSTTDNSNNPATGGVDNSNSLQLNNLLLHGDEHPAGHPDEWGSYKVNGMLSLNMETNTATGRSYLQLEFPDWISGSDTDWSDNMNLTLGQMKYQGVDFGYWALRDINIYDNTYIRVGGRNGNGSSPAGIDFEISSRLSFGSLTYDYGGGENYAEFGGISLCSTVDNVGATPSTWNPSGLFQIGDYDNGAPLQINAGSNGSNHSIELYVPSNSTAPINGTIAMENMRVGGVDFGPSVIKGINVTYLRVTMNGN